ncbi:MAG: mannosyltransferase family protein [Chloroflexota bacterium]|nr:mannosyltransferase family protein [Chloroflexota bacterium]
MMQAIQTRLAPFRVGVSQFVEHATQPQYYWITRPLLALVITRLIVFFGAYVAEIAIPGISGDGLYHVNPNNILLDVWARWDSAFYLRIVEQGYWFVPGQQSSVAFFPLYPLLMSFAEPFVGSALAAGVLVSNLCLFGALVFLYRLTEFEFDANAAGRTVFYIAAFPTAFFFSAVYTESTFLLFTVSTMYFARRRMWAWAALFGVLCASSRIVGVVIWGIVGLEWLRAHGWTLGTIHKMQSWRNLLKALRVDWLNLAIICLIPLGLITYMVFLNQQFGDPFAFSTTQSAWGRQMLGPVAIIWRDLTGLFGGNFWTGDIWYHVILDLGAFFAVLGLAFVIWRRLGASYALYCLISILIPASSGTGSLSRYALVIFPVFMMLGHWGRHHWLDRALLISFSVMLGILTTVFVNWIFVA